MSLVDVTCWQRVEAAVFCLHAVAEAVTRDLEEVPPPPSAGEVATKLQGVMQVPVHAC
jgi:hypothetical protein